MKDILSAFSTDVFRPLITLFIPGVIALSSWIVALFQVNPTLRTLADRNRSESVAVIVAATLFSAMIVEDWGSRLEARLLDPYRNRRSKGQFLREWQEYLLLSYASEPVARGYLRGLHLRLKFELDAAVALGLAALGSLFVDLDVSWSKLPALLLGFALYLFLVEARATHKLMGEVRHSILSGNIRLIGTNQEGQ